MNERELRDLVNDDPRLRRVHEDLMAAGPPPELPAGIVRPPWRRDRRPRRRRLAAALVAATLAGVSFGAGYLTARSGDEPFATTFVVVMQATEEATEASASLAVGERDEAGNWPLTMTVRGLPRLPAGEQYELVLTRGGTVAASCGLFVVEGQTTDVYLNAPYRLRAYDGWAVTRADDDEFLLAASLG